MAKLHSKPYQLLSSEDGCSWRATAIQCLRQAARLQLGSPRHTVPSATPLQTPYVQTEVDIATKYTNGHPPSTATQHGMTHAQHDVAAAISQARGCIRPPNQSFNTLVDDVESVVTLLAETTLVASGSEVRSGQASSLKRGRGRPRKNTSVQQQGKDAELGLAALVADACAAFASLPDTFAHPAHFARALFALGQLGWQVLQLVAVLSVGPPRKSETYAGVKASLLSGLQVLMASAPEGCLQAGMAGGGTGAATPQKQALSAGVAVGGTGAPGSSLQASVAGGGTGAATPQKQALLVQAGNQDKSNALAKEGGLLGGQWDQEGRILDAATVQCLARVVAALEDGDGPPGIAFCVAAWELLLPGMQSFWSLEHQMDGAAMFLQCMAAACCADRAASPSGMSTSTLVSIPTNTTCSSPTEPPNGKNSSSSSSSSSPTNNGRNVEQARLAFADKPQGPHTLTTANSSLLPAGILRDLSTEARALWLRVCCDTFAAPVQSLKHDRARALAAHYTPQPPIANVHVNASAAAPAAAGFADGIVFGGAKELQGMSPSSSSSSSSSTSSSVGQPMHADGVAQSEHQNEHQKNQHTGQQDQAARKRERKSKAQEVGSRRASSSGRRSKSSTPVPSAAAAAAAAVQAAKEPGIADVSSSEDDHAVSPAASTLTLLENGSAAAQTSSSNDSGSSSSSSSGSSSSSAAAMASYPDGAAARRLVLATAAYNRCCRAGLRHKDCFVVTQAWVDAVVAPALRSLSRPVMAGNIIVLARLAYMAASALGLAANGCSSNSSSSSRGSSVSSSSIANSAHPNSSSLSRSGSGGMSARSSEKSASSGGMRAGSNETAMPVAPPGFREGEGVVSLMELQALLGALRELQGSSSWTVPSNALESLDAALAAKGACCLHDSKATTATSSSHFLPPRPTAPPAHVLASSSGMLQYVFAVEPLHGQQQQQQGDDQSNKAPTASPQADATVVLPFADSCPPASGHSDAAVAACTSAAAAADRATSILQLLKARSSLGRASRFPPSAFLLATASGAVMEAADRVTRARTTAMTQVAIQGTGVDTPSPAVTENNSSSSSSSSSTDAGRVSAILPGPQPPKGGTELRMVAALQDLLSLLADQLQLCEQQQQQQQRTLNEQGMQHIQPEQQQLQLSALTTRIDAVANKLYLLLALLPDEAWQDAGFLTRTFPKLLQLCVGQLGQRSDLLQPDRWVPASLSLLLNAPSPALNVDAYTRLTRGARTLPAYLLLDPLAEHTWWRALDNAVAATVSSAATIAFLRPHRWLKLLRLLTEVVERGMAAPETAGGVAAAPCVEFPATAHAVGVAAASNPALFGGFGRLKHAKVSLQGAEATPLFGGAANLNGEVGALLPRLCVRKAELMGVNGLDWLQEQTGLRRSC